MIKTLDFFFLPNYVILDKRIFCDHSYQVQESEELSEVVDYLGSST